MENASKALLMAGGILIALIIIAILTRTYTNISLFQRAQLTEEEQAQLVAFNEQYTKYLGEYVYGTEIITVINKTMNNTEYKIKTIIKFAEDGEGYLYNGYVYNGYIYNTITNRKDKGEVNIKKGETLEITNDGENSYTVEKFINSLNESGDLNKMAFKCTNIGYDSYGRVNSIKFEEKKWGDLW